MDSLMQDDFIRTLMDDRELSHKQAVKLWNKHGEEYMETIFEIKEILYGLYMLSNYIRIRRSVGTILEMIEQIVSKMSVLDRTIVSNLDYLLNRMYFLRYAIRRRRRRYVLLNVIRDVIITLYKYVE